MRTMYIILSWIGWGWFVLIVPTVAVLVRRQGQRPVQAPHQPSEAEVAHEQ